MFDLFVYLIMTQMSSDTTNENVIKLISSSWIYSQMALLYVVELRMTEYLILKLTFYLQRLSIYSCFKYSY